MLILYPLSREFLSVYSSKLKHYILSMGVNLDFVLIKKANELITSSN